MDADFIVLGGGPGGYVAALRAAQLDQTVVMIDEQEGGPGGVCVNWGCIPTKVLLHQAEQYHFMRDKAEDFGFEIEGLSVHWERMIEKSRTAVDRLTRGVTGLLKKNGVEYENDRGKLVEPGTVEVEGDETYEAEHVLLATGARPRSFPGIEPNEDRIITSKEAMMLNGAPERLIVMGAGAIGMEFAYFFHTFGTDVTVLEMEDHILPQEDREIAEALQELYTEDGMDIRTGAPVEEALQEGEEVRVKLQDGETLTGDRALVALGLVPNTDGVWSDKLNLRLEEGGWIAVKTDYRTSIPGVYAAGDVIGPPWLAHVATHEGINMVESAFTDGEVEPLDYETIPAGTFCQPQVASVGLTESEARGRHESVRIGRFPFRGNGRAVCVDELEGFVKLVFAGEYDELVGAHILGDGGTELIGELALASRLEATPEEIFETVHPHPTRSEAVMEAALDAEERVLHI